MARIRTVKPELWNEEPFMGLSRDARLLLIGLKNFCDDQGVHPLALKTIKANVFCCDDDVTSTTVQRLVDELLSSGYVGAFQSGSAEYLAFFNWDKDQRIDRKTKKYPAPPSDPRQFLSRSKTVPRAIPGLLDDVSPRSRRDDADGSTPEWSGVEGSGEERKGEASLLAAAGKIDEVSSSDRRALDDTPEPPTKPQAGKAELSPEVIKLGQDVLGILGYVVTAAVSHFGQVQPWLATYTPDEIRTAAHAVTHRIPKDLRSPLAWFGKALPDEVEVIRRVTSGKAAIVGLMAEAPADLTGWRLAMWKAIGPVGYASWIQPAVVTAADTLVDVCLPTPCKADWVRNSYGDTLRRLIMAEMPNIQRVEFRHENEMPHFLRRSA